MDSSIMEDSVFDDYGDSDAFSPEAAPKLKAKPAAKAPALKKAAASKAKPGPNSGAKTTAAPKKVTAKPKAAASKKRPKEDTENEESDADDHVFSDESLLKNTPPQAKKLKTATKKPSGKAAAKALQSLENESMGLDGVDDGPSPKPKTPGKGKKAGDQYQKLSPLEHILKRPDTYIGSIERTEKQMWVYNTEQDTMEYREVSYVPGLYKIFDEVLVNAADNKQRDKKMDEIRVTVDREKGEISVWNNGRGIPIEIHSAERIWVPELIFGHLLTSSNYDDEEAKTTGGRNGYGAKLCNIFSTKFTVETADSKSKKKYKQTWTANMSKMQPAKINEQKGDDFTTVTFTPDFAKFGMAGMDDDFEALVKRRVYDLAGTGKVGVKLNGRKIPIRNFKKYIEMYTTAIKKERGAEAENDKSEILVETPDARWEIGFAVSDGSFQQVSFVNSIATTSGGTHVNYIADQICAKLADVVKKKNKAGATLKPAQIRNHLFLFVNALIVNPAFTSQTKEQLTTKVSQFGSKCVVSDDFLKKIEKKTDVVTNILSFAQHKADQILKKSDGGRRSRMSNPKLTDANKAGTKDGHHCTLILTEGDSAKGLAMAGRAVVGPDLFGVFPLRGKLLNVRDATVDQISKNTEIQNIKSFLGLQHKKDYADTKGLRYGHLMIMTDQDHDGSHIKGLLINFLQVQFPSLLKIPEFLIEFITPIVKAYKGDPKNPSKSKSFFTMPEYEAWKEEHKDERGWDHKYYKGLGTSTTEDAQIYFRDLDRHLKEFHIMKDGEQGLIELAFSKKKADERKEWLRNFKPGTFLDHSIGKISYTDFINKELILFSMADNIRSIPSVVDGLKPGMRKVLFASFKRNLKKDMKVVELAGYVSGITAYQHGETSLQSTIVGLAQTFVGSNNINCLEPSGNFGSRLQGGGDCASARYIYTRLSPFARRVFHPADEPLLTYNTDDERKIEPEVYVPVVPMVLINGADGIGTGWSSSIPNYNPEDIVDNLRRMMDGEELKTMHPWFRGFTGGVEKVEAQEDRYKFSGIIKQTGPTEVEITELPIRMWTQDFKDRLEEIIKAEKIPSFIKDYKDYNTHMKVNFIIQMDEKHMEKALEEGLEDKFKLTKSIATSNLVAFDPEGRITKYASVEDIMKEFFAIRIKFYEKRKQWQLQELQKELDKLSNQARFVQMIIAGKLVISKKKKAVLIAELKEKKFKAFPKSTNVTKAGELEPFMETEEEEEDASTGSNGYDYLLGMALWSLTQERVERLLRQIGEKEVEIDVLIKLSKEDLWKKDLDDFIAEWRFQLEDEHQRARKVASLGRRVSAKLKTGGKLGGAGSKKRKAQGDDDDDDDDFDFAAPAKKKPIIKKVQPKAGLSNHMSPQRKASITSLNGYKPGKSISVDGGEDSLDEDLAPIFKKTKAAAKAKTTTSSQDNNDMSIVSEVVAQPARQARAVTKKAIKYLSSDSEDDDGDKLLGDITNMVKGTTGGGDSATETRTLFSISHSRPGSSAGFSNAGLKSSKPSKTVDTDDLSADETDYAQLVPQQSPRRSIVVTAKDSNLSEVDDDDSDIIITKPPKKVAAAKQTKAAPKTAAPKATTGRGRPKKPDAPVSKPEQAKKAQISPTAKAYAARQAKATMAIIDSDDEIDTLANDILDSPANDDRDESPASRALPTGRSRRAASVKQPAYTIEDDSLISPSEEPSSDVFSGSE